MVSNFMEVDYVTTRNLHCVCTRVLCKLLAASWRISILTQFTQPHILENIGIDLVAAARALLATFSPSRGPKQSCSAAVFMAMMTSHLLVR